ncbi:hypothetical protein Pen01_27630 [Phytomonospora endophytica]|nr:hypothetical protein Pen01_27630 [Phytomonospora endophytica]
MSEHSSSATPPQSQLKITVADPQTMVSLLGSNDEILRYLERSVRSDVHVRGNEITLSGTPKDVADTERLFNELIAVVGKGEPVTIDVARRTLGMLEKSGEGDESPAEVLTLNILSRRGRTIRPKTMGQKKYVDAIDEHTIVFGIGPAGTGKTYLAMAKAVQALQAKQVTRIILTRPAVEAGERLGYLPGTLFEKIDPYLRPLYDALHDMVDPDSIPRLITNGTIEVAPLAYMRGRAQPVSTPVLTPEGWRPIGELQVGDLVVGSNGEPTPVLGVYPQGEKDVFRIRTRDAASTVATGDHLWTVDDGEVKTTAELIEGLPEAGAYRLPLLSGPAYLPARETSVDPYELGLRLWDGCLDTVAAGQRENEAVGLGRIVRARTEIPGGLGLTGVCPDTAFVPADYLHNTHDVRLAVLQGLLDADGRVATLPGSSVGEGRVSVRYITPSTQLRDDLRYLVRSLGGVVDTRVRNNAHTLDIRLPAGVEPFRRARNADKYRAAGQACPERHIVGIEPEGRAEAVCIQVAAADSLYVTEDFILTHNTLNDAFIILDEAQNTTPEQMKMFLTRLGFGSKVVVTGDITQIDLPGASVSGLRIVRDILHNVEDVHFSTLGSADVVRHRLVGDIVDAYEKWDAEREQDEDQRPGHGQQRPRRTDRRSGRQ